MRNVEAKELASAINVMIHGFLPVKTATAVLTHAESVMAKENLSLNLKFGKWDQKGTKGKSVKKENTGAASALDQEVSPAIRAEEWPRLHVTNARVTL